MTEIPALALTLDVAVQYFAGSLGLGVCLGLLAQLTRIERG